MPPAIRIALETRRSGWSNALFLIVLVATAAIYWRGLFGAFFFDDLANIVENSGLRVFDGTLASLIEASRSGGASSLGRPIAMASFAVNLYLTGYDPFYFKLTNLAIHLANGLLVFILVRQVWPRLVGASDSRLAALLVSALWLLHPINLSPVLFVVQRMTGLATFFTLLALSLYLYGRGQSGRRCWASLAGCFLVAWPLGILSKETALLLPAYIALCEWLVLEDFRKLHPRIKLTLVLSLGAVGVAAIAASWNYFMGGYINRDFNLVERLMTEARVLWFYLRQMFLPIPVLFSLHHDDIQISRGFWQPPSTWMAVLAWPGVLLAAYVLRHRWPWLMFAVAWYLAGHVIESTIVPLEIAFEHRNHVPSLGPFIALVALLAPAAETSHFRFARLALIAGFIVLSAFFTTLRAAQWSNEYIRTQFEVAYHPDSRRSNYEAGLAILNRTMKDGRLDPIAHKMAHHYFQNAAMLDHGDKSGLLGMLYVDCAAGMPKDTDTLRTLTQRFATGRFSAGDRALIIKLPEIFKHNRLCASDADAKSLLNALLSNPRVKGNTRALAYVAAMGYELEVKKSFPAALDHARVAVESDPKAVDIRIMLIRMLLSSGGREEARQHYEILLRDKIPAKNRPIFEEIREQLRQGSDVGRNIQTKSTP